MKEIPLTQGKVTVVDDDVYEWASKFKWYARKGWRTFYACRTSLQKLGKRRDIFLHREIMQLPDSIRVDHRDEDGLNNRRENLRPATKQQNAINYQRDGGSSKFRGVCWHKQHQKWGATIRWDGRQHHLGYFKDEELAARAYDASARINHGEFARPNFK